MKALYPRRRIYIPLTEKDQAVLQLTTLIDEDEGTAFHLGEGIFLTAAHVFDKNSDARIGKLTRPNYDDVTITASVVNIDYELDIALLLAAKRDRAVHIPAVSLKERVLLVGDSVIAYGFPQYNVGNSCSHMSARLTGVRQVGVSRKEVDRAFPHGASGGPVFDSHGIAVGIVLSGPQLGNIDAPLSTTFTPYSAFKTTLTGWLAAVPKVDIGGP